MQYKKCIELLATLEDPDPEFRKDMGVTFASTFAFTRKDKKDPMFDQWWKMVRSCYDTTFPLYRKCGAILGVGVARMNEFWHDFSRFKTEFNSGFNPELGTVYLCRWKMGRGFFADNCFWGLKTDAMQLQGRTVLIETQWGMMSIKQLALFSHGAGRNADLDEKYWSTYRYVETDDQMNRTGTVTLVNRTLPLLTESLIRYRLTKRIPVFEYVYPIHTRRADLTGIESNYRHVLQKSRAKKYVPTGRPRGRPLGSKNKPKPLDDPAGEFPLLVDMPDGM